ncbi:alpha/beta hydrolase fold domain-containing protein [Arthrobacter yangruifuii]|uniref:Alpha/beta hydrolase fold domain-containing protein n=1 Tax=Arthrobacter yangruifuii TaxID=2606616 RepID=A0A5N6MTU3_9MICC|nr:alpha/beta hydrolase [Arthrobacter yangruifuii]KAD4007226.1 alpha/beta hydrolase fold domain-containing protein [Arthrobacter yangruifuii]
MPTGYLITVILLGLSTLCALAPPGTGGRGNGPRPRSPFRWGTAAYLAGMTLNEAPMVPLLFGAAVTALAVTEGEVSSAAGMAAAAGMALVAAGLRLVAERAVRHRAAPAQVLETPLGHGRRNAAGPRAFVTAGVGAVLAGLFLPFRRRRRGVRRLKDLQYGEFGRHNTLDLYLPRTGPAAGPVFVHFHGGRFVSGAKNRESLYLLYRLASHGWTCISANYRLAPAAGFPDYAVDAKRVIAWVRTTGAAHGAGGGPVVVAGSSAGAFLAAFAALTPNQPDLQPGFEDADTSVAGAACLYGYYGRVQETNPDSTPAAHLFPGAPPFFLLHGDKDSVVPVQHGHRFARALAAVSRQPVFWCRLPGAQHSFDYFASVRTRFAAPAIEEFADWAVREHQTGKGLPKGR